MPVVGVLVLVIVASSAFFGCVLAWLFARKGLAGPGLQERLSRLETDVRRLTDQEIGQDHLGDEVLRLDEKVRFLEDLLASRPKTDALPPGE